jgi:glycine/D-amino acid oxidase-like deaminating enzyme
MTLETTERRSAHTRTHGLWALTAQPLPHQSLSGQHAADVAVVGAGYTGLSAALHLAALGARVVVLEAHEVGYGGSGRNVGLVNAGLWVRPDQVVATLGSHYGERLLQLLDAAPGMVFDIIREHRIDCEADRSGTLHCGVGKSGLSELQARLMQWSSRGAPVELLDAQRTAVMTGSTAFAGALWDRRAGTIQPLAYARGLARAALAKGAQVFCGDAVESIDSAGASWRVATRMGAITAGWVVLATDVYGSGPWPQVRTEQIRLPYFNFATLPLAPALQRSILPQRQGAWTTERVLSSFRVDQAGRLVFGSIGALQGAGLQIHRAWAQRAVRQLFPQLGKVDFAAGWFGAIGMTADSMPRFHKLAPNIVSFSGYNGRGIAPGTAFGALLARYISGAVADEDLPLPPTPLGRPSLRRARELLYLTGSQLVHWAGRRL